MLEKKDYVSVSKRVHKQKLQVSKVFVTRKNFILLSKENTQMLILGSQSYVPRDPNRFFWLAEKCFTLFEYEALIKMLRCLLMQWTET